MMIDTLDECIIDMNTIMELKTASADSKNQATANHKFKQLVSNLKDMTEEVYLAVQNSDFCPSAQTLALLGRFVSICDKVVQDGAAVNATTDYIKEESRRLYGVLQEEWAAFYEKTTSSILSLLKIVDNILPDGRTTMYAVNKIKKASGWNHSIQNYNYLKQGITDGEKIISELDLNDNPEVLDFLKLISEGNATVLNLTDEILAWIRQENLAGKMKICF